MPDTDQRIQAMSSLIRTDAARVIPMLGDIALEVNDPGEAGRAVFALAQSDRPEARQMVIHIAKVGPEPVRVAAVKQLGRFTGPEISGALLGVYTTSGRPVRLQVVRTLGERADKGALLRIAESEKDPGLRDRAIIMLGQAGGDQQLATLYPAAGPQSRLVIIIGLFNARSDTQLIRVAEQERNERLRAEAIAKLRLLGSPKAKAYLLKLDEKR
jgi:HEAT repeat protein